MIYVPIHAIFRATVAVGRSWPLCCWLVVVGGVRTRGRCDTHIFIIALCRLVVEVVRARTSERACCKTRQVTCLIVYLSAHGAYRQLPTACACVCVCMLYVPLLRLVVSTVRRMQSSSVGVRFGPWEIRYPLRPELRSSNLNNAETM